METHILNYRIIITPEKHEGRIVYNAFCPTLGVADWGKSIEQAKKHIQGAMECYIESLIKHEKEVPEPDTPEYFVSHASVTIPANLKVRFI